MTNYIVYEIETGDILRTGICPDDMIHLQVHEGELVMEGIANDIEHKIEGGKIVRRPEEEINAIRKRMQPNPQEQLIREKMNKLLREQAIIELKKEGKL